MFSSIFSYGQNPDQVISLSVDTNVEKLKPGDTTWIFIEVTVKPGWHAYWKTAGQTGFPTTIDWDLPSGISVGTLHFPTPQYYEFQGLGSYVHEDTFTLLAELSLSRDWNRDDPLVINGRFSTLVCDEANCIPFDEDISLAIEVGDRTILIPGFEQKLEMAKSNWPILAGEELQLSVEVNQQFIELLFVLQSFKVCRFKNSIFFRRTNFLFMSLNKIFNSMRTVLSRSFVLNETQVCQYRIDLGEFSLILNLRGLFSRSGEKKYSIWSEFRFRRFSFILQLLGK